MRGRATSLPAAGLALLLGACATPGASTPERLPALAAELELRPGDIRLRRRVAASYAAAGQCAQALAVARPVEPTADEAWPTLVEGVCHEQAPEGDSAAIRVYRAHLDRFPQGRGSPLVRGRLLLAQEREAVRMAGSEAAQAPDNDVVGVVPLRLVSGDERYRALEIGLAAQLVTDLHLLQRFPMVERLSLTAVVEELRLTAGALVEPTTMARLGRIVQAGRLVSGSVGVPGDGTLTLESVVVSAADARPIGSGTRSGRIEDLFDLEKEMVFDIARQLGYVVSEADRTRVLRNGTRNVEAFLAYSRGLEALDEGDYATASRLFADAHRLDGDFREAREMLETSEGARASDGPAGADILRAEADAGRGVDDAVVGGPGGSALGTALGSAAFDVAPTQGEGATGGTGERKLTSGTQQAKAPAAPQVLRVVVIIPGG